eukprot:935748_1
MDIFHLVMDTINAKLRRNITYIVYNTDEYPSIRTVSYIPRSIKLGTVGLADVLSLETQLITHYPDDHILSVNVYNNYTNDANKFRIVKSHLYEPNFIYMTTKRFMDGFAQVRVSSSLEDNIKNWLQANKRISTSNATQRILRQVFDQVEDAYSAVDANMTKYQRQVLRASYLNGLPFDFMIMQKEMVLDRNVIDLLLMFAETSFVVALKEMSNVLEWILTKSKYGQSEMLQNPQKWKRLFGGLMGIFRSTLTVTIKALRDVFVSSR